MWIGQPQPSGDLSRTTWRREVYPVGSMPGGGEARVRFEFVQAQRPPDDAFLAVIGGKGPGLEVRLLRKEGAGFRTSLAGAPSLAMIAPMVAPGELGSSGTLAVVWPRRADRPEFSASLEMREVSALTGRVMYAGPSRSGVVASHVKLQSLAIWGVMFGVGVLFFLLRTDPQTGASGMPRGIHPASMLRRGLAAAIDYAPSAVVVALAQGRSPFVLLTPQTMIGGGGDFDRRTGPGVDRHGPVPGGDYTRPCVNGDSGDRSGKFAAGAESGVGRAHACGSDRSSRGSRAQSAAAFGFGGVPAPATLAVGGAERESMGSAPLALFALLDVIGRYPADVAAGTLVVADENDGT